jgi:hypothetical protein
VHKRIALKAIRSHRSATRRPLNRHARTDAKARTRPNSPASPAEELDSIEIEDGCPKRQLCDWIARLTMRMIEFTCTHVSDWNY